MLSSAWSSGSVCTIVPSAAAAATEYVRFTVSEMLTTSPSFSRRDWIFSPPNVRPLRLPESTISQPSSTRRTSAWWRETTLSSITTSQSLLRPSVIASPSRATSVAPDGVETTRRSACGAMTVAPAAGVTIVAPASVGVSGAEAMRSGAKCSIKAKGPIVTASPSLSDRGARGSSSSVATRVPLALPRSMMRQPAPSRSMRAWRRET